MRQYVFAMLMFFTALLPVRAAGEVSLTYQKAMEDFVQKAHFLIRNNIDWRMVRLSDAEAVLVIRIGPQGVLESVKVVEHSDDPTFDFALESAIRRTIPMLGLPPTPPGGAVPLSIPMRFHVMR